jgi:hypothetical protein
MRYLGVKPGCAEHQIATDKNSDDDCAYEQVYSAGNSFTGRDDGRSVDISHCPLLLDQSAETLPLASTVTEISVVPRIARPRQVPSPLFTSPRTLR